MDAREQRWIADGWEDICGPWKQPSLRDETETRAAELSEMGRRPASYYGWEEDDEATDHRSGTSWARC